MSELRPLNGPSNVLLLLSREVSKLIHRIDESRPRVIVRVKEAIMVLVERESGVACRLFY